MTVEELIFLLLRMPLEAEVVVHEYPINAIILNDLEEVELLP